MRKHTNELKLRPLAIATASALALSAPLVASAQTQTQVQAQAGQQATSQASGIAEIYKASNWLGKDVQNPQGEEIGEVSDLVFDDMGRVEYVVLEHGGFLSIGEHYVLVPFRAFQSPIAQDHLVLAVSKQQLGEAPAFDEGEWPSMAKVQGTSFGEMSALSPQQEQLFKRLDKNNDGVLTAEEASEYEGLQQQFTRLDSYGNDRLTRSEFAMFEIQETGESWQGTSGTPAYEAPSGHEAVTEERGGSEATE